MSCDLAGYGTDKGSAGLHYENIVGARHVVPIRGAKCIVCQNEMSKAFPLSLIIMKDCPPTMKK
jgi:hypothetical protein